MDTVSTETFCLSPYFNMSKDSGIVPKTVLDVRIITVALLIKNLHTHTHTHKKKKRVFRKMLCGVQAVGFILHTHTHKKKRVFRKMLCGVQAVGFILLIIGFDIPFVRSIDRKSVV